jgi:SAM-dependent methyltransferase/Tfp pilus assembly protein PilF
MSASGAHGADTDRIDGLYELAFRRHQAGQFGEAEQLYRSILEADPRQVDCWHFLGMIALQDGRPEAALDLMGKAIAANGGIAAYHGGIAEAFRALGRRDEAIAHYRKAVAIDPKFWAAHNQLADLARDAGESAAAIEHYGKAVVAKPDLAPARHNLAALLLEQGRANEALDEVSRAVLLQDTRQSRALFVQCVRSATKLPGSPEFRHLLTRALTEVWGRPVELAGAAITLVRADATIRSALRAVDEVWPRRLAPSVLAPAMTPMLDPLLHRVMESTPVSDEGMERLLASTRTLLLDAALDSSSEISSEMMPLACALARQCFINEYVFDLPDVERDGMMALRGKLMSVLPGAKPVLAIQLIAYACFAPLRSLTRNAAILARIWPEAMSGLIAEQLREPEVEAGYRAAMRNLTAITDDTSLRVRQQYEDNPYPRWTKAAPVQPASGIAAYLRGEFPLAPLRDSTEARPLDILIAGCGTGQQPIDAAQQFPDSHVLAIDLSLTSLAYAQRKAAELDLTGIEFAQADIVALELPGRTFDVIEASGVLHHLADPMQGWAKLLRLLKPGGFMRLGLHSAVARADVVTAREFVAAGGYDATPDSIRRCRQNLTKARDPRLRGIFASPDFYSVSACRDLLFHAQEHRLTLPQIAAFLAQHDLAFLGFELDAPVLARYRARFPDDAAMTDLAQWHLFESEHPDTFGGMYQFWVQAAS